MAAVDNLTRQMLAGEQLSSVAALASGAPEWARAFVSAAEGRVRELDDALASARGDIGKLRARAEQFVAENEQLHERLAAELEKEPLAAPAPQGTSRAVIQGPVQERSRELGERVDILMAENALMVEQTAVLQAELDRCSGDLDARTKEATSFRDEAERATEKWRALEGGEGQWREARKRLEERYVQHSTDMAQASAQLGELKEGLTQLHAQNGTLREQLDEKTRACQDLTDRLEADGDELWQRVQAAGARCREFSTNLAAQTQRGDLETEKARRAERALEQVRGDNAGMLRVMSGMEKQLASYAQREEGVAQAGRDAKEKAENALLARDKAQAKCDQALRELERLRAERVNDAESFQTRCREAVEVDIRRLQQEVRRRDQEIRDRDEKHAGALAIAERHGRDLDRLKADAARATAALKHCQAAADAAAEGLERRSADADQRTNDAVRRARDAERQLAKSVEQREADREENEAKMVSGVVGGDGMGQAEARDLAARCRESQSLASQRERESAKAHRELEAEKQGRARDVADARRDGDAEKRRLEEALDAQRRAASDAHFQVSAQTERHRGQLAKVAADRDAHARDADQRLRDEHETVARLAAYERELEVKLAAAAADLDAQRDYGQQLAERCQVAERRAGEAATALSKSIAEQDLLIKRYARQGASAKALSPLGSAN